MINILVMSLGALAAFTVTLLVFNEELVTILGLAFCIVGLVLENNMIIYLGYMWLIILLCLYFLVFLFDRSRKKKKR